MAMYFTSPRMAMAISRPVGLASKNTRDSGAIMKSIKKYWALWLVLGINTSLLIVAWIILR